MGLMRSLLQIIPTSARWLAQDADGRWWGYESKPDKSHSYFLSVDFKVYETRVRTFPMFWEKSLNKICECGEICSKSDIYYVCNHCATRYAA